MADSSGLTIDPGTVSSITSAMDANAMISLQLAAHSSKDQAIEGAAQDLAGTGSKVGGG